MTLQFCAFIEFPLAIRVVAGEDLLTMREHMLTENLLIRNDLVTALVLALIRVNAQIIRQNIMGTPIQNMKSNTMLSKE